MDSSNLGNRTSDFKLKLSNELVSSVFPPTPGILTQQSKHLLILPSSERNDDAIFNLLSEIENIKFFHKFPYNVKKELAQKILYVEQDANSVLLRQGEKPLAMYVILSGVISLRYKFSQMSEHQSYWPSKFLRNGDYFGHHDIIMDRSTLCDAKCMGYSELLLIKKEDFHVIHKQLEEEISIIHRHMRSNRMLGKFQWTDEEYEVLEMFSDLTCYFEENEIRQEQNKKPNYWSYFVVSGECKLVRKIKHSLFARTKKSDMSNVQSDLDEPKTYQFEIVRQGFYFNVGEDFGDNHVIASAATECLMVLRLLLKFKNKELLNQMAMDLYASLPTDENIIDGFLKFQQATEEVNKAFEDIFIDKPWVLERNNNSNDKPPFIKYV